MCQHSTQKTQEPRRGLRTLSHQFRFSLYSLGHGRKIILSHMENAGGWKWMHV